MNTSCTQITTWELLLLSETQIVTCSFVVFFTGFTKITPICSFFLSCMSLLMNKTYFGFIRLLIKVMDSLCQVEGLNMLLFQLNLCKYYQFYFIVTSMQNICQNKNIETRDEGHIISPNFPRPVNEQHESCSCEISTRYPDEVKLTVIMINPTATSMWSLRLTADDRGKYAIEY